MDDWYRFDGAETLDTPALLFYEERIAANIAAALRMVREPALLRPHVKTHKCAGIVRMMTAAGITKFKCATVAEAEMLGAAGAPDVLLAYQPAGSKALRLLTLVRRFPDVRFSCLVDDTETAAALDAHCAAAGVTLDVWLDLNVGQNRTGVVPHRAPALAAAVQSCRSLRLAGLHAYDGHITTADPVECRRQVDDAFAPVFALRKELDGIAVIAGGSPTFPCHAGRGDVECSPGTFALWDGSYQRTYPDQPFLPAALLMTSVVSVVNTSLFCTDLGHKSVASEGPIPRLRFVNAPEAMQSGHSEEHMVVTVPDASKYRIGDRLYAMPNHICPSVSMYERAAVVSGGRLAGEWPITARDKRLTV